MKLVAAGCSWTDPNFKSIWNEKHMYTRPWPTTLAKELGMDCVNLGRSGNCIEGVARDVIDYVTTYGEDGIGCVAVLLPPWSRFRYGKTNVNPYSVFFNNMNLEWKNQLKAAADEYIYYHQTAENTVKYALTWMLMICEFLEKRNIPYVIAQGCKAFHEWHTKHVDASKYPHSINENRMHKYVNTIVNSSITDELKDKPQLLGYPFSYAVGGYGMKDALKEKWGDKSYTISKKDGHPSDEGHDYIAKLFHEHLIESGVLE